MRAALAWIGDRLSPFLYFALAGKAAEPSTGDSSMAKLPSLIARLRRAFHSLDELPATISSPWREGNKIEPLPIEVATIDDIAVAVLATNADVTAAIRRSSALERLHRLAREAGALGTDCAVDAALKREGR